MYVILLIQNENELYISIYTSTFFIVENKNNNGAEVLVLQNNIMPGLYCKMLC